MIIVGLTGSFGTGKTTTARMFKRMGAHIISADKIAHRFIPSPITRRKVAKVVFKRKRYVELICKILHPLIISQIKTEIKKVKPTKKVVVIDAPLLFEAGLDKIVDVCVVVKAKRKNQIERLKKSRRLTTLNILRRIKFQLPLKNKLYKADFVIDNNGSFYNTYIQVKEIYRKLIKREPTI